MSGRAFKGIVGGRMSDRQRRDLERRRRTDVERRDRMRELDDATPYKPSRSDLIVGAAAERELERIEAELEKRGPR